MTVFLFFWTQQFIRMIKVVAHNRANVDFCNSDVNWLSLNKTLDKSEHNIFNYNSDLWCREGIGMKDYLLVRKPKEVSSNALVRWLTNIVVVEQSLNLAIRKFECWESNIVVKQFPDLFTLCVVFWQVVFRMSCE